MADPEGFAPLNEAEARAVLMFRTRRTLDGEVALGLTAETFALAWLGWGRVRTDSQEEMRSRLFMIAGASLAGSTPRTCPARCAASSGDADARCP